MSDAGRPWRSVLYIPGSKARALEKARSLPADAIIFDLEDAVAPDEKVAARALLAETLGAGLVGHSEADGIVGAFADQLAVFVIEL